jgi:hypothetical protein
LFYGLFSISFANVLMFWWIGEQFGANEAAQDERCHVTCCRMVIHGEICERLINEESQRTSSQKSADEARISSKLDG